MFSWRYNLVANIAILPLPNPVLYNFLIFIDFNTYFLLLTEHTSIHVLFHNQIKLNDIIHKDEIDTQILCP